MDILKSPSEPGLLPKAVVIQRDDHGTFEGDFGISGFSDRHEIWGLSFLVFGKIIPGSFLSG